ncbi:MAG: SIR2 family protein [Tannerellaceae bacterium]
MTKQSYRLHKDSGCRDKWDVWLACIDDVNDFIYSEMGSRNYSFVEENSIEDLLSYLRCYQENLENKSKLHSCNENLIKRIEVQLAMLYRLNLPEDSYQHRLFLLKLVCMNIYKSVSLYTTNYDTLFEQAASRSRILLKDGFSLVEPYYFSKSNYDQDFNTPGAAKQIWSEELKILPFYKLHGSIDWVFQDDGHIIKRENTTCPYVIYDSEMDFSLSFSHPFFDIQQQLEDDLAAESTLLLIVGYSFRDRYISSLIEKALAHNPDIEIVIVHFYIERLLIDDDVKGEYYSYCSDSGICEENLPAFLFEKNCVKPNVTIIWSTFKDFVDIFPLIR